MQFDHAQLLGMYADMLKVRYFEETLQDNFERGRLHGTTHLCIGQEASAVGACSALEDGDYVLMTHRGHGQVIASGADLNALMAEMYGKKTGCAAGKGGSMHFLDMKRGIIGENGVVGATYPLACGAALTQNIKQTGGATLCFGGDGSVNEGTFHESLNLAAIWKLPVVFFIENNLYAMSTPVEKHSSVINLSERAQAYGIPGIIVDGNDVIETYGITKMALEYARAGNGPVLIEAQTYRVCGHSKNDKQVYRGQDEVGKWRQEDPIPRMADYLLHHNIADAEALYTMEQQAREAVAQAVTYAEESPEPDAEDLSLHVYAR